MRAFIQVLFGAVVTAIVAGCLKFGGIPSPASPKVDFELAKPEKSVPADTAGEPDNSLVEAGRQQLKNNKYSPMPVYSRTGNLGIIRLVDAGTCKIEDAIVILETIEFTDSRLRLENGYVFFNVDKRGPVKVGEFELKKGECVLFKDGQLNKLDLVISVK
jgi:hypothetical protein